MNRQKQITLMLVLALAAFGALAALPATAQTVGGQQNGYGYGRGGNGGGGSATPCCLADPTAPLTADEANWLAHMREEEKLARDIYQQLFAKWKLRNFANIARSEQRHFEAMGTLLAEYGAKDPAATTQTGEFVDQKLGSLYQTLLGKGMISIKDAVEVGLAIETLDISDLEVCLKATQKTDLKTAFTNLLAGSLSHQESFENSLELLQ